METASSVYGVLEGMPVTEKYLPDMEGVKKAVTFGFYVRNTIPWKTECEAKSPEYTRERVFNVFAEQE